MKEELVRVHARLCGDGCITRYETSESDRNRRAMVLYTNVNEDNLNQFRDDMGELFDIKMYEREDEVRVKSIRIADELERKFGKLSSEEWRIPEKILNLRFEKKIEWIRAFIRDEGYHETTYNRLKIKSMNKSGLSDLQKLFESIGVESNLNGPNCDDSYYLTVPSINDKEEIYEIAKNKPKVK